MSKYRVANNTDYRVAFETENEEEAWALWNSTVAPREDAGNAYSASIQVRCKDCDEWQDATAEHATCACN